MMLSSEQMLERKLFRLLNKSMREYHLIDDDDRILIGLSGGKDSLCLTDLLARRAKISRPKFVVEALHVTMENIPYEVDRPYLTDFCNSRDVRLNWVTASFEPDRQHRTNCYLCSKTRRNSLFTYAREHGFGKVALGHHNDDLLQTLLMNELFEGSFATMPAILSFRKMPLALIRPLCKIPEKDLQLWAEIHEFKTQTKRCPYEQETKRARMKKLLEELVEINPEVRYSLWHALEKEKKLSEP